MSERHPDHEIACNIAEDLDNGHIFPWRVEQVLAHLDAGGTTDIDDDGELILVMPKCGACNDLGFQAGAHTERVNPCPSCQEAA